MAFNFFKCSALMDLTIRTVRSQRPFRRTFSVLDVENRRPRGQFPGFVRFLSADVTAAHEKAPAIKIPEDSKAAAKSSTDLLDGLPFDVKEGGPEEGYLTLIKKYKDEIIEVKVRPCYWPPYCSINYPREDKVDRTLRLLQGDDEKGADKTIVEDREFKCLYMVVNIYYKDQKCVKFLLDAWDEHISIRSMSLRAEEGTKNVKELEDLFKERVMDPRNINISTSDNNILFACSEKKENLEL